MQRLNHLLNHIQNNTMTVSKSIELFNAPVKAVDLDYASSTATFKKTETEFSTENIPEGKAAVKVLYLSNDPTQRGWMQKDLDPKKMYVPPIVPGEVIRSFGLCKILATSPSSKYAKDDIVLCLCRWSEYAVIDEQFIFNKIDTSKGAPLYYFLSVFGITSLTAWAGLTQIGKIDENKTIIISAASGATGSVAVQLAKKVFNAKNVIGITGSKEKCDFVKSLGADHAIDYHDADYAQQLVAAVGDEGADIYWDNVGGEILDVCLDSMKNSGIVIACGAVAGYNDASKSYVKNWAQIIVKSLTVKGFIVTDYAAKFPEAFGCLAKSFGEGKIKVDKDNTMKIFDCSGDKFYDIPSVWHKLFTHEKPNGKLITFISDP